MPVKIPNNLPAREILNEENIFTMDENRAYHQDIRPLKILILNLMPTKIVTETQLLRVLSNTPLQLEITFIHPKTYDSKNTPKEHLFVFYKHFDDIKENKYDGMIITGAPVEQMEYHEVDYWEELQRIFQWSKNHVTSTLHICWGAQAGLYYHYGVPKFPLSEKKFGVFPYETNIKNELLFRGFDDVFYCPQSRHTEVRIENIIDNPELEVMSKSIEGDLYIVASKDRRQIFITGHSEYDPFTLKAEYDRDVQLGLPINVPENYYPNDNPELEPIVRWRGHSHLLFSNWLNYYVYQETPYDLNELSD